MASLLKNILNFAERFSPAEIAYAHCDIPCGIYDPHEAQMSAHTVIRMDELISQLKEKESTMSKEEYVIMLSRYASVKEEHAENCKHQARILWGDYFKPEHAQKYPQLQQLVWDIMKQGSECKQKVDVKAAESLLESVNKLAEIFWDSKGIKTQRVKVTYWPTNREIALPKF